MRILQDIMSVMEQKEDLTRLPKDIYDKIKRNIRKGAEDISQKWGNALELVHKAYLVSGVERPDPSMETAWQQYEELLQYAVQQLAKNRGMDGDWRMSSAMFHEALTYAPAKYRVMVTDENGRRGYVTEANSIDDIIARLTKDSEFDVAVDKTDHGCALIRFSRFGVYKPTKIEICHIKYS